MTTQVNEVDEIVLDSGFSKPTPTHTKSITISCAKALMKVWSWRSRARSRKQIESRAVIVQNIDNLTDKINVLDTRQITYEQIIKQCVCDNDKVRARRVLLQKKGCQNMLLSLSSYRDELDAVLMSLDESNEQQQLVASFKSANQVLRTSKVKGLNGVEVFDTLADDLHEARQDVEDLQHAVTSRAPVDTDLEDELGELFDSPTNTPPQSPQSLPILYPDAPTGPICFQGTKEVGSPPLLV